MESEPNNDVGAAKRRLRREVKAAFRAFDPESRRRETERLIARAVPPRDLAPGSVVLLYIGHLPEELPTHSLVERSLAGGLRAYCPRVDAEVGRLRLIEVREVARDLAPGAMGIPEPREGLAEVDPADVDWALVPGLAFDAEGRRLGRGAAYYDRLLPLLRPEVVRCAAAYSIQMVERVPVAAHDQRVDVVIGPERTWTREVSRSKA